MTHSSVLFLALLLVATTSVANSLVINGTQIAFVNILGQLVCAAPPPAPPPPPNPQPIAGVNVVLLCDGGRVVVTQALTDINGFYRLTLDTLRILVFNPSSCQVVVRLPIIRCAVFPLTGSLVSALSVVSVLPIGGIVGALGDALIVALPPTLVP